MTTRIISAVALILGPVLWLAGLVIRHLADVPEHLRDEPFAAPGELAAYHLEPDLVIAGYAVFLAGAVTMVVAVAVLARLATDGAPLLAPLGGLLLAVGLIARAYWAGVEQAAFSLVDAHGLDFATTFVLDAYVDLSYGPWRLTALAAFGQYVGGVMLAAGLYRARVFGLGRSVVVAWWATIWTGVLKAAGWWEVPAAVALVLVLVPLAIAVVRFGGGAVPGREGRRLLSW